MAKVIYKQKIDLLETLASLKVNEVVRMSNNDMKLSVVRTMYRRYKLESMLDGTFSFIKSNNGNYIILRTA